MSIDDAEMMIYDTFHELLGVQGENLAYYLSRPTPLTPDEAIDAMRDLRAAYTQRVRIIAAAQMED